MAFSELVQPLIERKDLDPQHAEELMRFLMSGEASDSQIGAVLFGLRMKGCTTRELAAFARVMREKATILSHPYEDAVDTCGTGGGIPTFNISTASAIVASAAGVRIAKHGNRSMSGQGSADVLEAMGVTLTGDSERLGHMFQALGIVFLFAPAHHSAMRHVSSVRKELGVRTVFNQLGPLLNPAGAKRQLIGVYDPLLMRSMGEALRELGTERALIVHGHEGIDEISPTGETDYVQVWEGRVTTGRFTPESFGLAPVDPAAMTAGADLQNSAAIFREAVSDPDSPRAAVLIPNAAAAIYLAGIEDNLPDAANRARSVIASGQASDKLNEVIQFGGLA